MFDVVGSEIGKHKPDLAIIAYPTFAVEVPRLWRVEATIDGEPRVFTTTYPTETPDPTDKGSTYDTFLLHPGIDAAWCEKYKNGGALDQVGQEMISKHLRFRTERFSVFTLSRSFFFERLINHDPFFARQRHSENPVVPLNTDKKLADAIRAIHASHIPTLLVHLPVSTEVAAGKEFSMVEAETRAESFHQLSGMPTYGLLKYIGPIDRPERMNSSPVNMHPSEFGMELYANAVSEIILQEGLLARQSDYQSGDRRAGSGSPAR
jgi:hypothetical protein